MNLVYIFAAILAVSVAETSKEKYDDLVAMETMELKKESSDLTPEASVYNYVQPNQQPLQWAQNYVPHPTWTPPKLDNVPIPSIPNVPSYIPPVTISPPANNPPVQSDYVPPQNNYPQNYYPQNDYPQNDYPQKNYPYRPNKHPHHPHWTTPHHPTTTTPSPVIKNEQHFNGDGSYSYEYQLTDGTWVGESGGFTSPDHNEASLFKKGWYSYKGADGKTYTVTYWADHTGFHAYGDHLPTPPPAVQSAINNEHQQPTYTPYPTYPTYQTTQKPHYPTYYPPQQPGYGKK